MALSDRIAVLSNGKLIAIFDRDKATEADIVAASAKGHGHTHDNDHNKQTRELAS
jgi:erythritol transport system ATP-binding protein